MHGMHGKKEGGKKRDVFPCPDAESLQDHQKKKKNQYRTHPVDYYVCQMETERIISPYAIIVVDAEKSHSSVVGSFFVFKRFWNQGFKEASVFKLVVFLLNFNHVIPDKIIIN